MNKTNFGCNVCGAKGTIKLDEDHEAEVCPACGSCLDIEHDEDEDE